jgi:hypothetical protein
MWYKNKSLFLSLLFILIVAFAKAQNYSVGPSLEIEDMVNHKVYKLRKNKTFFFKTTQDSIIKKDKIWSLESDSIIVTQNNGILKLADIELIGFKPEKIKRTFKQVFAPAGIVFNIIVINNLIYAANHGHEKGPLFLLFTLPALCFTTFACIQVTGELIMVFTPKKNLNKKDFRLKIVPY